MCEAGAARAEGQLRCRISRVLPAGTIGRLASLLLFLCACSILELCSWSSYVIYDLFSLLFLFFDTQYAQFLLSLSLLILGLPPIFVSLRRCDLVFIFERWIEVDGERCGKIMIDLSTCMFCMHWLSAHPNVTFFTSV